MAHVLTFDSGPLQARILEGAGSVALAGPDLAGAAHANIIVFEPPVVTIGGRTRTLGRVVSSASLPNGLEVVQDLEGTNVKARLTFPHDGVMRYEVVDFGGLKPDGTRISAASDGNEHFYGFGEKFNALDQAGNVVDILTFDHPEDKGDRSYKVAPWFISTRGYGLHFDSTAEGTFDLKTALRGRYTYDNRSPTLAFNVVYGPRLPDVLRRYTGYSGRPTLPPPFAFGPWISSDIWRNGGEVRYAVLEFRARHIPASAFVFDSPWEEAYNNFRFNMTQFGTGTPKAERTFEGVARDGFESPEALMTSLRENGLKVIVWMTPFVNDRFHDDQERKEAPGLLEKAPKFDEGTALGVFVRKSAGGPALGVDWWKGHGGPVDFTSATARTWLTDQLEALIDQSRTDTRTGTRAEPAIGGFKTDDGEARTNAHANHNASGDYIPLGARYADGRTGREMRNGYCVEYLKTIAGVLGPQGLIFARSGFTGAQAFPGCWAGDNQPNFSAANGLPSVIVAGLSAAMSGFSIWGHDVGGYQQGFEQNHSDATDLFLRWTQFGCFTPIMQMHRTLKNAHEDPAHRDLRQYPWGYGNDPNHPDNNNPALENFRLYADFHNRLFPYIYTFAQQSSETGLPIMRPLVLMDQEDTANRTVGHTYLFGDAFLVAPMIAPGTGPRQVRLPLGDWLDFWDHTPHAGRADVMWSNPDRRKFPLYVRRGAIVPMLPAGVESLCDATYVNNAGVKTWDKSLVFRIYPSGNSDFTAFDGTKLVCQVGGGTTTVTLTSAPRAILLQVATPEPPQVTRDGTVLPKFSTEGQLDGAANGWRFGADPLKSSVQFLFVKFSHTSGTTQIIF